MQRIVEVMTSSCLRMCFFLLFMVSKISLTKRKAANKSASPEKKYSRY